MAVFSGLLSAGAVQLYGPASPALSAYDGSWTPRVAAPRSEHAGNRSTFSGITVQPKVGLSTHLSPGFDGELMDKVLVIPRIKSLGFVLGTNTFNVEVWSTHRKAPQVMTALAITGSGDLSIAQPFPLPLVFFPMQSRIFLATVPQDGAAQINNVALFTFTGVLGTDLTLTGSRLAVFAPAIDWATGFSEGIAYLTTILKGYTDKEQRVQMRTIPRYSAAYRAATMTARESAEMDSLLWGRKSGVYGVPWWPEAQPLGADLAIGNLVVTVDPTSRPGFVAGGLVMLWRDQFTYEALTIQAVGGASITLSTAVTKTWAALGTLVIPLKRGRLRARASLLRPAGFASAIDLAFDCEVV